MLRRLALVATMEVDPVGRSGCSIVADPYPPHLRRWIDQRLFRAAPDEVIDARLRVVRAPRRVHVGVVDPLSGEFWGVECEVRPSFLLMPSTRTVDVVVDLVPSGPGSIPFDEGVAIGDLLRSEVVLGRTMEVRDVFESVVSSYWPAEWSGIVVDPDDRTTFGWVGFSDGDGDAVVPTSSGDVCCEGIGTTEVFSGGRNHIRLHGPDLDEDHWSGYLLLAAHAARVRHLRNRLVSMVAESMVLDEPRSILAAATGVQGEVVTIGPDLRGVGIFGNERLIGLLGRCHGEVVVGDRELAEVHDGVAGLDRYASSVFQANVERAQRRFSVAGLIFATISLAVGTLALLDVGQRGAVGIAVWICINAGIAATFVTTWNLMKSGRFRR